MTDLQIATAKPESALVTFRGMLTSRKGELAQALQGTGVSPDQMIRAATTCVMLDPELIERVSFRSFWLALLRACRDGLLPDGVQGAIVSYKHSAQWVPMYRGLLLRFERSGQYKEVWSGFHRSDDIAWRMWSDEHGPHFLHEQGPGNGVIIETFAAARTVVGGFFISIINEKEMERIRAMSRATREDSPWNKWPDQMKLKSAFKRLCKTLPMTSSLALDLDDDDAQIALDARGEERPAPLTVRGALDQFAPSQPAGLDQPPAEGAGPQAMTQTPADVTSPPHMDDSDTVHGPEASPKVAEPAARADIAKDIAYAYERGKQDRVKGMEEKASPPEYRNDAAVKLFEAWRAGWRGQPIPK
jgi:recombinational DNA repair protein RecT